MKKLKAMGVKSLDTFIFHFRRTVQPDCSQAEIGDIYGGVYQEKALLQFSLCVKKPPRGWGSLNHESLRGDIDESGNVTYYFKRTWEARILTVIAPILVVLICHLGLVTPVFLTALWGLIPAAFLFAFNFIKPKKRRQILTDRLMCLIDASNNRQ